MNRGLCQAPSNIVDVYHISTILYLPFRSLFLAEQRLLPSLKEGASGRIGITGLVLWHLESWSKVIRNSGIQESFCQHRFQD